MGMCAETVPCSWQDRLQFRRCGRKKSKHVFHADYKQNAELLIGQTHVVLTVYYNAWHYDD
eukprot:c46104_g1_i1 orf=1-180(-)